MPTVLTRSEFDRLPAYDETATYRLASVGWLRKHLGWRKDAKSDVGEPRAMWDRPWRHEAVRDL